MEKKLVFLRSLVSVEVEVLEDLQTHQKKIGLVGEEETSILREKKWSLTQSIEEETSTSGGADDDRSVEEEATDSDKESHQRQIHRRRRSLEEELINVMPNKEVVGEPNDMMVMSLEKA